MASSAALRFACRALHGQPPPFPRALVADGERFLHRSPTPWEIIAPRRLYSTESVRTAELNPKCSTLDPLATAQSSAHELAKKVTSEGRIRQLHETRLNIFKRLAELLREKKRNEIRRRSQMLAGGSILTGLAIYAKFFHGSQEAEGAE